MLVRENTRAFAGEGQVGNEQESSMRQLQYYCTLKAKHYCLELARLGMFRIELLPAACGDCLWIEYGPDDSLHRVLVDGGPPSTYDHIRSRLMNSPEEHRVLDLVIATHIDNDHIGGLVRLLHDPEPPDGMEIREFWFNHFRHLPHQEGMLGIRDGEHLSTGLEDQDIAWNSAFGGQAVRVETNGPLPSVTLQGGMRVTVIGPTPEELGNLAVAWDDSVRQMQREADAPTGFLGAELDVEELGNLPSRPDRSIANASSIAVLFEFEGVSLLALGDANSYSSERALRRLAEERGCERLLVDACKVGHHGSAGSTLSGLVGAFGAEWYLFSTNGRYGHPDPRTIARILKSPRKNGLAPKLCFNYRSEYAQRWEDWELELRYGYETRFTHDNDVGLRIELIANA